VLWRHVWGLWEYLQFLTSALNWGKRSISLPGRLTHGKSPIIHSTPCWVCSGASQDVWRRETFLVANICLFQFCSNALVNIISFLNAFEDIWTLPYFREFLSLFMSYYVNYILLFKFYCRFLECLSYLRFHRRLEERVDHRSNCIRF
jgi:hypothetical protein